MVTDDVGLATWEHKVLLTIALPINFIGIAVNLVLKPIYMVLSMLVLPLVAVIIMFTVVWLILMAIIWPFCKLSLSVPILRPLSFICALPFLIIGYIIVTISPVPSPSDAESKMMKWQFIEVFPHSFQFMRGVSVE